MCYEKRVTIEHRWNGCSEMRERERKERQKTILKDEKKKEKRNAGIGIAKRNEKLNENENYVEYKRESNFGRKKKQGY
jgi:hypothetical protein